MNGTNQEVLLDDALIEKDFNDAMTDLQKSLESDIEGDELKKGKGEGKEPDPKPPAKDDDEEKSEDDEEKEMDYEKSISEILAEDPNATH